MDDVSAVCGSKMVPFQKREKQTELTLQLFGFRNASPTPSRKCLVHSAGTFVLTFVGTWLGSVRVCRFN
jgi:hypothetical protein